MNQEQWEHFYRSICLDFDFDPDLDFKSSLLLSSILQDKSRKELLEKFRGDTFYVVGNGPNLSQALDLIGKGTTIVADSTLEVFLESGRVPDIVVTDLDGSIVSLRIAYNMGAIMVIHAHGDNRKLISEYAEEFSGNAVGTTQNRPVDGIYNFFGFTDGDRAAYLAHYLDAVNIYLVGFDFDTPVSKEHTDPSRKKRKLNWAKILLEELAKERGTSLGSGPVIPL